MRWLTFNLIIMNPENDILMAALHECATACELCFSASLRQEHINDLGDCIRFTAECAKVCRLTESLLASESRFTAELVDVCSDVCAGCARECEQHEHKHCKICAAACRKCEEACENFAPSTL